MTMTEPVLTVAPYSRKLPSGPLLSFIDREHADRQYVRSQQEHTATFREAFGISPRTVIRMRAAGVVPIETVERVTGAAGLHPVDLYGDDYWQALGYWP